MKNILSSSLFILLLSCSHQTAEEAYLDKNFNPSDMTFAFEKVSENRWQIMVKGEWDAATQKKLLKKLSQVGAQNDFSYFKIDEAGRFPASEGKREAEAIIVEYSHFNSPDYFYSVDGILARPSSREENMPMVHKRAREY